MAKGEQQCHICILGLSLGLGDGERGGLEAERVTQGQAHLLTCGLGNPCQAHGKGCQ